MVVLLLLRGHLLRVLRLGRVVFPILLRRAIHGLLWLWLIALLVGLILLLCWLVIGRLLWRLIIRRLLLLWLLPRVPHGIPAPGPASASLRHCADDKKGQRDEKQEADYPDHCAEYVPEQAQAKRDDERKQYGEDEREKPNPSTAAVWSIVIVHFLGSFVVVKHLLMLSLAAFKQV